PDLAVSRPHHLPHRPAAPPPRTRQARHGGDGRHRPTTTGPHQTRDRPPSRRPSPTCTTTGEPPPGARAGRRRTPRHGRDSVSPCRRPRLRRPRRPTPPPNRPPPRTARPPPADH